MEKNTTIEKIYKLRATCPNNFSEEELENFINTRVEKAQSNGDNMIGAVLELKEVNGGE